MKIGSRKTAKIFPMHLVANYMDGISLATLPAIHALTGCDTTSKVGMKLAFMKKPLDLSLLEDFGVSAVHLTNDVIEKAERFLVSVCKPKSVANNFDELRYEQYHSVKNLDFWKLACTSAAIREHIRRAFLQTRKWYTSYDPLTNGLPDPTEYGYKMTENSKLAPLWSQIDCKPEKLPQPCTCKVCHSDKICNCRRESIPCSKFCKCNASNACKNILNE